MDLWAKTVRRTGCRVHPNKSKDDILEAVGGDKQRRGSGSCSVLAVVAHLHVLQQIDPSRWRQGGIGASLLLDVLGDAGAVTLTDHKVVRSCKVLETYTSMVGAAPLCFKPTVSKGDMAFVRQRILASGAVFPFLPPPPQSEPGDYWWSKRDFVKALKGIGDAHGEGFSQTGPHAQAIVGWASTRGDTFLVCYQSWQASNFTFVPYIPWEGLEVMLRQIGTNSSSISYLHQYFVIFMPDPLELDRTSGIPIPIAGGPIVLADGGPRSDTYMKEWSHAVGRFFQLSIGQVVA